MVTFSDHESTDTLQQSGLFLLRLPLATGLISLLLACAPTPEPEPAAPAPAVAVAAPAGENCGTLSGVLFGSIETAFDWGPGDVDCDSMLRPEGRGVRIMFSGTRHGELLALIISLPDLQPGVTVAETPTNVTLTVADTGRFFSTADLDTCWSDITRNEASPEEDRTALAGQVFCVAPLGEINGNASIQLQQLKFTAFVKWTVE